MAAPVGSEFDQLLATTFDKRRKQLVDNIFKSRVLLWYFTQKNKVRKEDGGHKIVTPLIYAEGQASSYGEWDAITITPQDGISAAEFPWRLLNATIAISGLQEVQNSGEAAILNLLDAKIMQAEETLKETLNGMLFGDGTGNSGKDWMGLEGAIRQGETGDTTYGGFDATDSGNAWWRSGYNDATLLVGPGVDFRSLVQHEINTASKGNDTTDIVLTNQLLYEGFENQLVGRAQYSDKTTLDAGYANLLIQGTPVTWDFDCPAETVYGLNSKYIGLVGASARWFKQSKFTDGLSAAGGGVGTTVDARYALITTFGNVEVSNRKRQWKIKNLDPAALEAA